MGWPLEKVATQRLSCAALALPDLTLDRLGVKVAGNSARKQPLDNKHGQAALADAFGAPFCAGKQAAGREPKTATRAGSSPC